MSESEVFVYSHMFQSDHCVSTCIFYTQDEIKRTKLKWPVSNHYIIPLILSLLILLLFLNLFLGISHSQLIYIS